MVPGMDSPCSSAPDHPDLKVHRQGSHSNKSRKTYLFEGISPQADVRCYNNTISGMERAIKERLLFIPSGDGGWLNKPEHAPGAVLDKLISFIASMKPLSVYTHPWDRAAFAYSYVGQKQKRYLRAAEQLNQDGLLSKDCNLKFFMKFETFNLQTKPNPSPRGINPPDDKYLVEFGRYIKPIEKKVYAAVETLFGYNVIVKGLNQASRGSLIKESWDKFARPVCVMLDASKFEQSVSAECIEFESRIYQAYYPGDKLLKYMMERQKNYKGKARSADGNLSFVVSGVRASGMNNTALGNCLISSGFLFDIRKKLRAIDNTFEFRAHVDGDDVIAIMSECHVELFRRFSMPYYKEAGFRMKMEDTVNVLEHIDFCQSRPVFDGTDHIMVRNMKASLAKDAVSKKPLDSERIFRKWSAAVGMGGISSTGGFPVHQSYYECILRASKGARPLENDPVQRGMYRKTQGMTRVRRDVKPEARCSYWLAFGIEPDAQIAIEEYYNSWEIEYSVSEGQQLRYPTLPWG